MKAELVLAGRPVVIDTNVWISAALSPGGAPAKVVSWVLLDGVPAFSSETFDELSERLWRPKFDRYLSLEVRKQLLHDIDAAALWCDLKSVAGLGPWSRDPDDDKFILTALTTRAPYLISGDQDLLSVGPIAGLTILSPSDALSQGH